MAPIFRGQERLPGRGPSGGGFRQFWRILASYRSLPFKSQRVFPAGLRDLWTVSRCRYEGRPTITSIRGEKNSHFPVVLLITVG